VPVIAVTPDGLNKFVALMNNDYTVKKPKDLTKININDFGELLWWSYYFGTSPEKLISLVQKTGESSKIIRKYIES
jgi:hypothetical protein